MFIRYINGNEEKPIKLGTPPSFWQVFSLIRENSYIELWGYQYPTVTSTLNLTGLSSEEIANVCYLFSLARLTNAIYERAGSVSIDFSSSYLISHLLALTYDIHGLLKQDCKAHSYLARAALDVFAKSIREFKKQNIDTNNADHVKYRDVFDQLKEYFDRHENFIKRTIPTEQKIQTHQGPVFGLYIKLRNKFIEGGNADAMEKLAILYYVEREIYKKDSDAKKIKNNVREIFGKYALSGGMTKLFSLNPQATTNELSDFIDKSLEMIKKAKTNTSTTENKLFNSKTDVDNEGGIPLLKLKLREIPSLIKVSDPFETKNDVDNENGTELQPVMSPSIFRQRRYSEGNLSDFNIKLKSKRRNSEANISKNNLRNK
jgi:hypothetical protein